MDLLSDRKRVAVESKSLRIELPRDQPSFALEEQVALGSPGGSGSEKDVGRPI